MIDTRSSVAIALAGSGGAGVMTVGALLIEAAARAGYYGLLVRRFGPQVRGGESAALLQLGLAPIDTPPDTYDVLVAVDWSHVGRFLDEIPLAADSVIVGDPKKGEVPAPLRTRAGRMVAVPFAEIAREYADARANVVALGVAAALVGLPEPLVRGELAKRLVALGMAKQARSGDARGAAGKVADASGSLRAFEAGFAVGPTLGVSCRLDAPRPLGKRWLMSGNEAVALGALRAGVRFASGYPITPATELIEWLAPRLEALGGQFVQAEDELAAINMTLGASFGGVPAMTVTSGPGLSLMVESLGLASATETPALVVDVQRAGPSTGIPTKSEQSDLNLAVYGAHGDAPRVVLAPTSIDDAVATTEWAVGLAESLQTPVVLLSDQLLGQARAIVDRAPAADAPALRRVTTTDRSAKRHVITDAGVSPVAVPGTEFVGWVAEGLTHDESGAPSTAAIDHIGQLDKRARKLARHDFGPRWVDASGDGDLAVIAWGSAVGPTRTAVSRLQEDAANLRFIALRLLAPLPAERLAHLLRGVRGALVVEQNHSGQLHRLLRASAELPCRLASFARPGPLPLCPGEVEAAIIAWSQT